MLEGHTGQKSDTVKQQLHDSDEWLSVNCKTKYGEADDKKKNKDWLSYRPTLCSDKLID
jgi:hypothetical protein